MTLVQAPPRDLFGPGQSQAIRELFQGIFVAELVHPSRELWLLFGWISDVEILDNRSRQFSSLRADWPATQIRLSAVLEALVERGSTLLVVLRDVPHNQSFVEKLRDLGSRFPGKVRVAVGPEVHEKGLLGDDFLVSGSMNLTFNGMWVNDEHVSLRTDSGSVEEWRVAFHQKWGGKLT
jgi:phosphatidylserine/phosphatidylglycerophosphate/cardiolipin synthase-like enzyme